METVDIKTIEVIEANLVRVCTDNCSRGMSR